MRMASRSPRRKVPTIITILTANDKNLAGPLSSRYKTNVFFSRLLAVFLVQSACRRVSSLYKYFVEIDFQLPANIPMK